jgi:hypothetical protein
VLAGDNVSCGGASQSTGGIVSDDGNDEISGVISEQRSWCWTRLTLGDDVDEDYQQQP